MARLSNIHWRKIRSWETSALLTLKMFSILAMIPITSAWMTRPCRSNIRIHFIQGTRSQMASFNSLKRRSSRILEIWPIRSSLKVMEDTTSSRSKGIVHLISGITIPITKTVQKALKTTGPALHNLIIRIASSSSSFKIWATHAFRQTNHSTILEAISGSITKRSQRLMIFCIVRKSFRMAAGSNARTSLWRAVKTCRVLEGRRTRCTLATRCSTLPTSTMLSWISEISRSLMTRTRIRSRCWLPSAQSGRRRSTISLGQISEAKIWLLLVRISMIVPIAIWTNPLTKRLTVIFAGRPELSRGGWARSIWSQSPEFLTIGPSFRASHVRLEQGYKCDKFKTRRRASPFLRSIIILVTDPNNDPVRKIMKLQISKRGQNRNQGA